jgi:hypothetical protein
MGVNGVNERAQEGCFESLCEVGCDVGEVAGGIPSGLGRIVQRDIPCAASRFRAVAVPLITAIGLSLAVLQISAVSR